MFFVVSKVLGFFTVPSNIAATLGIVGVLLLLTGSLRAARRLIVSSILLLLVFGYSPLGNVLMGTLEQRFPKWDPSRGAPTGIVVLGGAIGPELSIFTGEPSLNESAERITVVAELARRYPEARIVFSGGNGSLFAPEGTEAEYALRLFLSFGIARDRITLEDRSRNTAENATFTKALIDPRPGQRWLLVTSASHMPRAIGCFRHIGFTVEAYPVDWRIEPDEWMWPFASLSKGLARTDAATHEWVGLAAYRLTGRISDLFPRP